MKDFHLHIISDGTGDTAYRMLQAAMAQFQEDVVITRYTNVREESQLRAILSAAASQPSLVAYTFVTEELKRSLERLAPEQGVESIDLLGPLMQKLAAFFDKPPTARPGLLHQVDGEYFARISAIEYAIRHDDGHSVDDLKSSEIVLVGVSRTSKTPLSIYLAQDGWKVANVPIVAGAKLPKQLFEIAQHRIVGLTMNPGRLAEIRKIQLRQEGREDSQYANPEQIREELDYAHSIYAQNPTWPVIDVFGKSIEEISQEVLDRLVGRGRRL
ncbi:MAG: pyruvate, water dikinase regulatory protein [Acidobacteriota bacterium]